VEFARKSAEARGARNATFLQLNALEEQLPTDFEIIMCSLFMHHLSEPEARELMRRMAQATRRCVVVDDLRRTRLGYWYAWLGGRLLTRSPIVHTDGPLSVRAAFDVDEFSRVAREAGLDGAIFQRHWPQRFLMIWKKS
jgi:hypothetical protein